MQRVNKGRTADGVEWTVYRYVHKATGRSYVGCTIDLRLRRERHAYDARRGSNQPLHEALRRYGRRAFRVEVVERLDTAESAKVFEQAAIAVFNSCFPAGYNLMTAGGGGRPRRVFDRAKAKAMRKRGASYRAIGKALGVATMTARAAVIGG